MHSVRSMWGGLFSIVDNHCKGYGELLLAGRLRSILDPLCLTGTGERDNPWAPGLRSLPGSVVNK
jgi:hypothetical protein